MFGVQDTEQLFSGVIVEKQESKLEPVSMIPSTSLCNLYLRVSSDSSYYFVIQQDLISIILSAVSEGAALLFATMSIFKFFYKFYNQHKTLEVLMNEIFKFDILSVNLRRLKKSASKQIQQNAINSVQNKEDNLGQVLKPTINYSFFKYIKYLIQHCLKQFMDGSEDGELIISQIAKEKIEYDLDLSNILKKLYEIDCLKLFLFDDDQLMIFNAFSYPVFTDQIQEQRKNFLELTGIMKQSLTSQQGISKTVQEQQRIEQLQPNGFGTNNQSTQMRDQIMLADQSKIPINVRLAKINSFFKSQLVLDAKNLNANYEKIQKDLNDNKQANEKLNSITKLNRSLFSQINCNTQTQNFITQTSNCTNVITNNQINENNQNQENQDEQNIGIIVFEDDNEDIQRMSPRFNMQQS